MLRRLVRPFQGVQPSDHAVARKLHGSDALRLLVPRGPVDEAPLDGGQVGLVRHRNVPRRHLVVPEGHAVPVPLAEHEDRGLHLDRESRHLEGRSVLVVPEVLEELLVAGLGPPPGAVAVVAGVFFTGDAAVPAPPRLRVADAAGSIIERPPPQEPLLRAHARSFDDHLIGPPLVDELHVAVVQQIKLHSNVSLQMTHFLSSSDTE